jgi:hypothetical protein
MLLFGANANANFIDNGSYTTDFNFSLDWLDLSATKEMTMVDALAANEGWRFATHSEVRSMFSRMFDGYYDTNSSGYSYTLDGAYADQNEDVLQFQSLFGLTQNPNEQVESTYGLYIDKDGIVRMLGSSYRPYVDASFVYGNYSPDYGANYDSGTSATGTFLVRTSAVPVPAAVWLFGSALAGLGWMRRKQSV